MRPRRTLTTAYLLTALVVAPALTVGVGAADPPVVQADHGFVMDAMWGPYWGALWQKDPDAQKAMASTTKVMTAHLAVKAIEEGKVGTGDIVTFSSYAASQGGAQLDPGDGPTVSKGEMFQFMPLLRGMFVSSSNAASFAIAEHVAKAYNPATWFPHGTFVGMMNAEAAAMGLTNTHYTNAAGWNWGDFAGNEQSVRDLANLWTQAMESDLFANVARTGSFSINGQLGNSFNNYQAGRAVDYPGWEGWKNGINTQCEFCWVESATRLDRRLVAAVTQAPTWGASKSDARALLDAGFAKRFEPDQRIDTFGWGHVADAAAVACTGERDVVTAYVTTQGATALTSWDVDASAKTFKREQTRSDSVFTNMIAVAAVDLDRAFELVNVPRTPVPDEAETPLPPIGRVLPGWVSDYVGDLSRYVDEAVSDDVVAVEADTTYTLKPDIAVTALGANRYVTASSVAGAVKVILWKVDANGTPELLDSASAGTGVEVAVTNIGGSLAVVAVRALDNTLTVTSWRTGSSGALTMLDTMPASQSGHAKSVALAGKALSTSWGGYQFALVKASHVNDLVNQLWHVDYSSGAFTKLDQTYGTTDVDEVDVTAVPMSWKGKLTGENRYVTSYRTNWNGSGGAVHWAYSPSGGAVVHGVHASGQYASDSAVESLGRDGAFVVHQHGAGATLRALEHRHDLPGPAVSNNHELANAQLSVAPLKDLDACRLESDRAESEYVVGFRDDSDRVRFTVHRVGVRPLGA